MERPERRAKTRSKKAKRIKSIPRVVKHLDAKGLAKLKDGHIGCGCPLCKPWKHGLEETLAPSERRKLQRVKD